MLTLGFKYVEWWKLDGGIKDARDTEPSAVEG